MQLFACSVDLSPCPPESQQWVSVDQAFDPAALGITPSAVAEVCGWGVGVVLLFWSLGYGVGAGLKMIRLT